MTFLGYTCMIMYYGHDKVHTLKSNNFLAELFPPFHAGILCPKQSSVIASDEAVKLFLVHL